jgi:hypothetical protein
MSSSEAHLYQILREFQEARAWGKWCRDAKTDMNTLLREPPLSFEAYRSFKNHCVERKSRGFRPLARLRHVSQPHASKARPISSHDPRFIRLVQYLRFVGRVRHGTIGWFYAGSMSQQVSMSARRLRGLGCPSVRHPTPRNSTAKVCDENYTNLRTSTSKSDRCYSPSDLRRR